MSLPHPDDEAANRALDMKCADPNSVVSKHTVAQLAAMPLSYKQEFLYTSTFDDLGNLVRCALEAGVSANTTQVEALDFISMLGVAAAQGATRALQALLAGGAKKELADKNGLTALAIAAQEGRVSCLQLLLDAGANANAQGRLGHTPLMLAVMDMHVECARALLPASDVAAVNRMGRAALHVAVTTASEACLEMLLPVCDVDVRTVPGVDVRSGETVPTFSWTPLHLACQTGQLQICKALLGRGANRMARDSEQRIPLLYAAHAGHLSCVVMLVGRPDKIRMTPAEVGAADEDGCTALHLAAGSGYEQICGVLLGAGARLDAKDAEGWTPRMYAQREHPTNTTLLALLSGAGPAQPPVLVCDHCGKTAEQASVTSLKTCRDCNVARYCGKECQLAAWPGHKAACKARVKERETMMRRPKVEHAK